MKILLMVVFGAFYPGTLNLCGDGGGLIQGSIRTWGQAAFGLRASISMEQTSRAKGSPLIVLLVVENISGAQVDLPATSAFILSNLSKTAPESTVKFGSYWCPVDLAAKASAGKSGLILAAPARIVMEKGTSIRSTIDLARHGWDKSISSFWPVKEFDTVVSPGSYTLRLDIQVGRGINPDWIRSNEVKVVIGK